MKSNIKTYQQAKDYLQGKKSRPYAHNTRIIIDTLDLGHEVITVTYHDNPVVNFFPDGTVTYSSCGWKTPTTKERINWFLPDGFRVYQEKSVWYLAKVINWDWQNAERFIFADGIAIKADNVYNAGAEDNTKQTIKAIKKFVDGYVKALLQNEVENPSSGDCWYCLMQTTDGHNLGEQTNNTDHILSHFEESYYVPSILMNAFKHNNRLSIMTQDGIARNVKSCLTAYLKHLLGVAA
jgi:hypothetical protein